MAKSVISKWEFAIAYANIYFGQIMEHGGVDTTVINSCQHKMGWMADFPPLLASSVFVLWKHDVPQIESQAIRHPLMNLYR